MPTQLPYLNVFLSSPGDVPEERAIARRIIKRLPNRYTFRGRVAINIIAWDDPDSTTAMEASLTPQEAINRGLPLPSQSDIVVVIFWSRLGTPFTDSDGTRYESGTHWELMDAIRSAATQTYIYRRTDEPVLGSVYDEDYEANLQQYQRLQDFFKSPLFYENDEIKRSVQSFRTPSEFERMFEFQFEEIVSRILDDLSSERPDFGQQSDQYVETIETKTWPDDRSPFPGLRAFTREDAGIFFGRGPETDLLVKRLSQSRFVAVAGASGSGKSSLVGAGLLPRLEANAISSGKTGSKDWLVASFTPGANDNPYEALADALMETVPALHCEDPIEYPERLDKLTTNLQKAPQNLRKIVAHSLRDAPEWAELLLFIDQFEELFTLANSEYVQSFAEMLYDAVAQGEVSENTRIRVVLTLRADFYHHAVEVQSLSNLLVHGSFPLSAPSREALLEMIKRPAERANMLWDEGLPERVLDDTGQGTGNLALMAYALDELYKVAVQRTDRCMTTVDYEQLGGVQGAIGARAEDVFKSTGTTQEALLRAFRRLVDVDESGTATRRRMRVVPDTLTPEDQRLLEAFVNARLLVTDYDQDRDQVTIEVAHEAIFREWPRLVDWIEDSQEDIFKWRQLRESVANWLRNERREAFLWPSERVELALESIKRLDIQPDADTQHFLRFALTPHTTPDFIAPPDADALLQELERDDISSYRRHWIGLWVSHLGDPRPGVGVNGDHLPDITWRDVPGGQITLDVQQPVALTVPAFQMARYPVTNAQFQAFIDADDGIKRGEWFEGLVPEDSPLREIRPPWYDYASTPRECVTWVHAIAFTRWLTERYRSLGWLPEGKVIRLPFEWEWELAATAGRADRLYPYGATFDETRANTSDLNFNMTSAVGIFPAGTSPNAIDDMSGNVWEWCLNTYYDPFDFDTDTRRQRVLRGGAWFSPRDQATTQRRYKTDAEDWFYFIGFRLCMADDLSNIDIIKGTR